MTLSMTRTPEATNTGYLAICTDEEAAYLYRSCVANVKAARAELEKRGYRVSAYASPSGVGPVTSSITKTTTVEI